MDPALKIVMVDENPVRAAILADGLREAGYIDVTRIEATTSLLARIYSLDPDVILIDLENPSRDVLAQMFQVSRAVKTADRDVRRPERCRPRSRLPSMPVSPPISSTGSRKSGSRESSIFAFPVSNAFTRLKDELERAQSALSERKVIDRAKGILMKLKTISEADAYAMLRKTAMNGKQKDRRHRAIRGHRRGVAEMMQDTLRIGFIPLVDAAALIVAVDRGFAAAEGLAIELSREVSWSNVRDKLNIGVFDAAHLLAPLAIASSLGIGHVKVPLLAPLMLGVNGNAITLSPQLYGELAAAADGDLADPKISARALGSVVAERRRSGAEPLTFGMTFPFSTHNYLIRFWMAAGGIDPDEDVRLVVLPPPYMVDSLASRHVDGFCVGAPWEFGRGQTGHRPHRPLWPRHRRARAGKGAGGARRMGGRSW